MLNPKLVKYIEENIIPKYKTFDKAHDEIHVRQVIKNSLQMADEYNVDKNIIYTAAAYHDLGLEIEREKHEEYSKKIMYADNKLGEFFNDSEKKLIADAILTHRASSKTVPKTIYGKIIADADNDLNPDRIIERMVLYSLEYNSEFDKLEHLKRCFEHGHEKYGHQGYLKLHLDSINNKNKLTQIRKILDDEKEFEKKFNFYYEKHRKNK